MPGPAGCPRPTKRARQDGPDFDTEEGYGRRLMAQEAKSKKKKKTEEGAAAKQRAEGEAAARNKADWGLGGCDPEEG